MNTKKLKRQLRSRKRRAPLERRFLSTGATPLNLACSGKRNGGFPAGSYVLLVGDSASGKTFLSMTCFAEAATSPEFAKHRLIYDGPEDGAQMDVARYFGKEVAKRLEVRQSETVEDFYDSTDDDCRAGRPFIKVLDSMDALTSEAEDDKFQEQKAARRNGRAASGSYGTDKARKNSGGLRRLLAGLRRTGSVLVIISQTRDNLGFGFEKKTRSGGRALRFYATLELWSSIRGRIRRRVGGQERQIGIICEIQVRKNRVTGRETSVQIPIYYSSGLDDTGACVQYLVNEGHWKTTGKKEGRQTVRAPEFRFKGAAEKLIQKIEAEGKEVALRRLVSDVWHDIEDGCKVKRKARYK